jgi:hypothetical protein
VKNVESRYLGTSIKIKETMAQPWHGTLGKTLPRKAKKKKKLYGKQRQLDIIYAQMKDSHKPLNICRVVYSSAKLEC